jgi:hypothetical protein
MSEDPASMRYVAAQLRVLADDICGQSDRIAAGARGLLYTGPAGDRFRQTIAIATNGVHMEATSLYSLAARLEAAALEAEQRARQEGLA